MRLHGSTGLRRRLLLALGGVALLDACGTPREGSWHAGPGSSTGTDSSPPGPSATPSAPPSAGPSAGYPTPAPASPGHCPPVPGIVQQPGGPQHYLPCSGTNIALTIDDGPDPRWTPQILALLARYHVPATFCMVGRHVAAYPGLVAQVVAAGHQVANHTFTHPLLLTSLPAPQLADEINRTMDAIGGAAGRRPTLFRSPGGHWSPAVLAACAKAGLRPLDWSVDPRDWSRPGVPHIVDVLLTHTRPGSIILDHDGGGDRQQTLDALTIALPRLLDAGYRFTQP